MGNLFQTLKPVIFTAWIVAAIRLLLDATSTDPNVICMASVYAAVFVMMLFSSFTGALDRLAWKGVFGGAFLLAVLCWFVPNAISYTVAQFAGWDHTRYHVDQEHYALQKRYMEEEDLNFFAAQKKANEELGRPGETRGQPRANTTSGKIQAGLTVAAFTTIIGFLWCLVFGILLVGIPASVRRKRGSG